MRSKTIILSTAAMLAVAGAVASPGYARTHHRLHHAMARSSTPAERAQTADLNRQQLQQAASAGMTSTGTATGGNPNLSTTPANYQRPASAGMSGAANDGTVGSTNAPMNNGTAPAKDMPAAGTDTGAQSTPGSSNPPPPADNSGGTQ